jgi:hypothetical protein
MKSSTIFYLSFMSVFSTLAFGIVGYECFTHYKVYKAGAELCAELGSEQADSSLVELAQTALKAMGVKRRHFVTFYKANVTSCTTGWQMWLRDNGPLGPTEFVVFHEAAHMALGHFYARVNSLVTLEMAKAQEIEADLLACQTLFELGMSNIILQRIAEIKKAIDQKWQEHDNDDHPTLREIYRCLTSFAQSKGLLV